MILHRSRASIGHRRRHPSGEAGTGVISSAAAVLVFLLFLLFAVQVIVGLYARSTVAAAGYDAARAVASRQVDHTDPAQVGAARRRAEARTRSLLGGIGEDARFEWTIDQDVVRLRLSVRSPGVLPSSVAEIGGPKDIERTFVVRVEEAR
ncbi:hypothetical protein BH10ACT1_BH10ACT1_00590 [soil metagenome]